jgi:hypothetical protein
MMDERGSTCVEVVIIVEVQFELPFLSL